MLTGGIEPGSIDRASSKLNLMATVSGVDSAERFRDKCGNWPQELGDAIAGIASAVGSLLGSGGGGGGGEEDQAQVGDKTTKIAGTPVPVTGSKNTVDTRSNQILTPIPAGKGKGTQV